MAKTQFTTITPLPAGISRETVLETLHSYEEMIDLNPSHEERHKISPPPEASPEEYHCTWYLITDKVAYLPAGLYSGKVSFKACFHALPMGVQTRCYAPLGLNIKEKWTIGGSLPHEPTQSVEIGVGAPISGLYLREDVEIKCNFLMTKFIKNSLKDALATLVARLVVKSQLLEANNKNRRLTLGYDQNMAASAPGSPAVYPALPLSPPLSVASHVQQGQGSPNMQPGMPYTQDRSSYHQYPQQNLPQSPQQEFPLSPQQAYQQPVQQMSHQQAYQQPVKPFQQPQQHFAAEMDAGQIHNPNAQSFAVELP